ncbi:MAG: glycosyltransferase [Caldilineae bacterium]|nr:MAG: glycosyltransferase [Caldilineae bacterium]
MLTVRDVPPPEGDNLDAAPLYHSARPSLAEKGAVYWQLLAHRNGNRRTELYHFIYRPYSLSSWLCRFLPDFRRRPTLHTVPATADGDPLARGLFFARRVVTLSDYGRQTLQNLGLPDVLHIPPGIDIARWRALSTRAETCKLRLGLHGHPILLFPGHYGPEYGSDTLLEALPHLLLRLPHLRVLFACRPRSADDEAREEAARRRVADMGLSHAVRFFSTVPDMGLLIAASDVTLLPLRTMRGKVDIPITLLESLAAGKPILISDIPPMNELVHRYGDAAGGRRIGLTIPPGDVPAMVSAVTHLFQEPALRAEMGRAGQRVVERYFDIRQVAAEYEKLYQEMASA